jgi:hypothetical protein
MPVNPFIIRIVLLFMICLCQGREATGLEMAALEWDFKATGTGHAAWFPDANSGQQENVISYLQVYPDLALDYDDTWIAVIAPRLRLGLNDSEYNLISLQDVYAEYVSEYIEVRAGFQTHFWGAVESWNIVDIFNQKDYRVDFFDPRRNKIGQSAVRVRGIYEENTLDIIYFPYFRVANLPNAVNPYNPFMGQLNLQGNPIFTNGAEKTRPNLAVRWERTIGTADIGAYYFNGYARFPVINAAPGVGIAQTLYYEMQQISADVTWNFGNWLLKGEYLYMNTDSAGSFETPSILQDGSIVVRDIVPDSYTALVTGFEYTFYRVFREHDVGLLLEYLYNDSPQDFQAPAFRPFENDIFAGFRWTRNNLGEGVLLAGLIHDLSNSTRLWRIEYTERFFDRIKILGYVQIIDAAEVNPLSPFNDADNLAFQLSYVY